MEFVNGTHVGNNTLHCLATEDHSRACLLQMILFIEVIVGLPGSLFALWIFCFRVKSWKPHVLFLFHLLLADFLLLISVPFRIDNHLQGDYWRFGHVWCRINLFMLTVNRSASIAFMTVVALDRYVKVVHPHHFISRMTTFQASWLSGVIWVAAVAVRVPLLTEDLLYEDGKVSLCRTFNSYEVTPLVMKVHYAAFVAEFFLPWFVLLFCSTRIACYLRQRGMDWQKRVRRAIRAVVVISLVFTFCFMPSVITGLVGMYNKAYYPADCASYNLFTRMFMTCLGFTYLNSALDPAIYFFSSSVFRDTVKAIICLKKDNGRHKC